ncbi:hypothetical protein VE03_10449 [Pseudogymnoascus sp. 23342-1-I1]|nr:hypothetical protein VE03_10449 [Pseudogymnoascus sp. 23342-1-I1]
MPNIEGSQPTKPAKLPTPITPIDDLFHSQPSDAWWPKVTAVGEAWSDMHEAVVAGPYNYLLQNPGKGVRAQAMQAFNAWMDVPTDPLKIIANSINMLTTCKTTRRYAGGSQWHTASMVIELWLWLWLWLRFWLELGARAQLRIDPRAREPSFKLSCLLELGSSSSSRLSPGLSSGPKIEPRVFELSFDVGNRSELGLSSRLSSWSSGAELHGYRPISGSAHASFCRWSYIHNE